MKKALFVLFVLSAGFFMTACSFHSEKTFETSVKGTVDFGKPKTPSIPSQPQAAPSESGTETQTAPATTPTASGTGTACHKHEDCNKKDELCVFSTCQSVSQLKQAQGFTDDASFDPCPSHLCPNCVDGKQYSSGMGYGVDDVNIEAQVCIDCQFNDKCNPGFRCVSSQCVDATKNDFCDFFDECLEGFTCESNKCVKSTEVPATE